MEVFAFAVSHDTGWSRQCTCVFIQLCFDAVSLISSFLFSIKSQHHVKDGDGFMNGQTPVNEKSKTRIISLLHCKVCCDFTNGNCVNHFLYRNHCDWAFIFHLSATMAIILPSIGIEAS